MNDNTALIICLMMIFLLIIPLIISKKTGKSYKEILLGHNNILKKPKPKKDATEPDKKASKSKHGSKNDLMNFASKLLTYARRHDMFFVFPGTVMHEDKTASLLGLLITGHEVIGFNCFGYGGTIRCREGDRDWDQIIDGNHTDIASPTLKNKIQYDIVRQAMDVLDMKDIPLRVLAVFTNSDVTFIGLDSDEVYTEKELMKYLVSDYFSRERDFFPEKIGKQLYNITKKNDNKKSGSR